MGRDRKDGIWFEVCSWVVCGRIGEIEAEFVNRGVGRRFSWFVRRNELGRGF